MSCLNPNDPKIATVVTNAKEMETALLVAKVLETSALLFSAGNGNQGAGMSSDGASVLQSRQEQVASQFDGKSDSIAENGRSYEFGLGGYPQRLGGQDPKHRSGNPGSVGEIGGHLSGGGSRVVGQSAFGDNEYYP
jgi:hypothetical protein